MEPNQLVPADYAYVSGQVCEISRQCPFVKSHIIGKSLVGRNIYALDFGYSQNKVLYAAAFHGTEWITSLLLLRFAQNLCRAVENCDTLAGINAVDTLKQSCICIVPCVNPDGVEIAIHGASAAAAYSPLVLQASKGDTSNWQANARGVDLNHNFDAGWCALRKLEEEAGITGPAPTRYGGPAPESEPETRAIADFCRNVYFRHAIAFHSQGQVIYYDYGKHTPKKSLSMAQVLAQSSGYELSTPEEIASMGGFKDWFIEYFCRPAFTIEVGIGENPLPIEQINEIYPRLEEMLMKGILL